MENLSFVETILIGMGLGWVGWVSIMVIKLTVKDSSRAQEMTALFDRLDAFQGDLKSDFADMKKDVTNDIDKVNTRFDMFLKSEIDIIKDALRDKK